jgi:hypothetical protein
MDTKRLAIYVIIIILIAAAGSFLFISGNSHNTKVEVTSNKTLQNGKFVEILLTDEYRNVYPGEVVDIKILDDSGWANKYQVTTDENGEANVELVTFENGNYTIHCDYNGTMFNKESHTVYDLVIDDGYN